ncbi:MAG TPA: hypothetical protein PKK66_01375 [Bacteroidales bacterium]|nr:hypothetical protein [Bacteroidales bacterium]
MFFKDVLVEDSLKQQLVALADENRISHAQLFLGKSGTHSFALAIAFAQYISCDNRHNGDSCGVCPSCLMFNRLQHPDLHILFPNCNTKKIKKDSDSEQLAQEFRDYVFAKNYHIDLNEWLSELGSENKQASINIRDCANIIRQNSIRAYANGYKFYILWMTEKLYHAAAPKLLKTLEEPENKTLFILIAENADAILPTILSRTQLVKIPPLSEEIIKNQLISEENAPETIATDIAAIADGSYVKALNLYQDTGELHTLLKNFSLVLKSIAAFAQNEVPSAINYLTVQDTFAEIIKNGKEEQKRFIQYMIRMFRNALLMQTRNRDLVKATADETKCLETYKSYFTVKNAASIFNDCNKAIYHIERNANSGLVFTDLYFKIAQNLIKK